MAENLEIVHTPDQPGPRRKTGRPPVSIDWDNFKKLCELQCTLAEIAGFMDCSEDTIERACKRDHKTTFADLHKKMRAGGLISIRRKQFQRALEGSDTMLIWLGKVYLEQTDQPKPEQDDDEPETGAVEEGYTITYLGPDSDEDTLRTKTNDDASYAEEES